MANNIKEVWVILYRDLTPGVTYGEESSLLGAYSSYKAAYEAMHNNVFEAVEQEVSTDARIEFNEDEGWARLDAFSETTYVWEITHLVVEDEEEEEPDASSFFGITGRTDNKYWLFLEGLRRSGITNMFGAAPYLEEAFHISTDEARKVLLDWMEKYDPEDYD